MASLSGFQAYADRLIQKRLSSSLFPRLPFLSFVAGKAGTATGLGRPGTYALIAGRGAGASAKRQFTSGSEALHWRFQTAVIGGGKYMTARGTAPSTGEASQDQNVRTSEFKWCRYEQPIKVWNTTLLLAGKNKFKIEDALSEATEMAMHECLDTVGDDLHNGSPTDQTADIWDLPLGIDQMQDTDNTYGNVARGTYTAWAGRDVTTAVTASLELIDNANLIQECALYGPGVDLVLTTATLYNNMKQEALARGATLNVGSMPQQAQVGFLKESINYNGVTITFDPKNTASYVSCLTSENIIFEVHPEANFKVHPFTDQSQVPGGDDAVTSKIEVMYRLSSDRPWNHCQYKSAS